MRCNAMLLLGEPLNRKTPSTAFQLCCFSVFRMIFLPFDLVLFAIRSIHFPGKGILKGGYTVEFTPRIL